VSISDLVALSSNTVFRILKDIASDLFLRKVKTYPRSSFVLELIKFILQNKGKKKGRTDNLLLGK
jgi:hypothetical protein